ncbi:MAG: hypothetical protein ACK4EY_01185 [Flavipsychrobacter sp.]
MKFETMKIEALSQGQLAKVLGAQGAPGCTVTNGGTKTLGAGTEIQYSFSYSSDDQDQDCTTYFNKKCTDGCDTDIVVNYPGTMEDVPMQYVLVPNVYTGCTCEAGCP